MATKKLPWTIKTIDGVRGIVLPDIVREDLLTIPSAAFGATAVLGDDGQVLDAEVPTERFVPFAKPGLRVEADRLYTVKAMTTSGVLVQVPLEDQINNQKAAPGMAVGLSIYSIKGHTIFYDVATQIGAYCPTKNCWAEWNAKINGFCTEVHQSITKPEAPIGGFSLNATTSAT